VGETTNAMPQPNTTTAQPAQQKQSVASPNPTIDDSKTKTSDAPKKVEGTQVQPAAATTEAPMKITRSKKSKHRRTKPSGD
jgi:hypothetical protein